MIKNRAKLNDILYRNVFPVSPPYMLSVNKPDLIGGPNETTIAECLDIHQTIEKKINPKLLGSPSITVRYGISYLTKFLSCFCFIKYSIKINKS